MKPCSCALAADDSADAELDAGVGRELLPAAGVERGGRLLIVAKESADAVGDAVALLAGVDHQRPAPSAAEHQRGAQARGAAAHHDAIPGRIHAVNLTHQPPAPQAAGRVGPHTLTR